MAARAERVIHPLDPIYDERSRVLLLGSMPSPASRAAGFYYGHPANRFWRVLSELFDEPLATSNEQRRSQLLRHHIALWDVLASCDISGASDASIAHPVPNDLSPILDVAPLEAVFCTGSKAAELYARYCESATGMAATKLPSTSSANASSSFADLTEAYRPILRHLHEYQPPVLDVARVVALEREIATSGTSLRELMERAGLALAYRVRRCTRGDRVVVLCGSGNNGGDGWVVARELAAHGGDVAVVAVRGPEGLKAQPAHDVACEALSVLERAGARVFVNPSESELSRLLDRASVIVDALLGTGFAGTSVKDPLGMWISMVNAQRNRGAYVIAADVPSGLNAQTGEPSNPCVMADETVTMIVSKTGIAKPSACSHCGEVSVAPLAYIEPLLENEAK